MKISADGATAIEGRHASTRDGERLTSVRALAQVDVPAELAEVRIGDEHIVVTRLHPDERRVAARVVVDLVAGVDS